MLQKLQTLLVFAIFLLALAIAIPTVSVNFREKGYKISNINPMDFGVNLITSHFEYKPALDLQGGYTVVFDVTPPDYSEDRLKPFRDVEEILARRMAMIGLRDFELTSFYNLEEEKFQLHLTTPDEVDEQIIRILASPGRLEVLIDDPERDPESLETGSIFDGRISSDITNEDIEAVKVVSDSRIYSTDAENPHNYGLLLIVKSGSASKLQGALINNISTGTPLIFTLDGEMVAIQSSGYYPNSFGDNDRLMLYTLFEDTKLNNSVIASVLSSPNLEGRVVPGESFRVSPSLGTDALANLKIASFVGLVLTNILLFVMLKRKALYVMMASSLYLVLTIAIQKMMNMNLSFALVSATVVMFGFFTLGQIILIRGAEKLDKKNREIGKFIEENSLTGWKSILSMAVLAPFIVFFENLLTPSVNQFIQVIILGIVVWLIYKIGFFKAIFNLLAKISLK